MEEETEDGVIYRECEISLDLANFSHSLGVCGNVQQQGDVGLQHEGDLRAQERREN